MSKVTYKTKIKASGNNTGLEVPPEVIAQLGTSKKPAVVVTIGSYTYRNTVAVMGDKFMISFSKAHREASGLKGGDAVEVTLELDTAPRTVEVPADLAAALETHPGATEKFDRLAPSRRNEFVRQVVEAKAQETRERRIAKIISTLTGG
ncbi:MAG: YdeI/OmpD-associated family protein [Anaerolineae bacterium]